jgi:hypothetical protein
MYLNLDQLPSSRLTMIIVDNELSLVVEETKYEDPVGIATYSNSESTVLSYTSIFENLWNQSEIKQQECICILWQISAINIQNEGNN